MDFVKDKNPAALLYVDKLASTPEYVENSEVITDEVVKDFSASAFADPINREFPIFSKAATWLSYAYYKANGLDNVRLREVIEKSAKEHGISNDLKKIDNTIDTVVKRASETLSAYALEVDIEDGQRICAYPINNYGEVIKSASLLSEDTTQGLGDIPIEYTYIASKNIIKAAKSFGVPVNYLPERIIDMGEERVFDFKRAMEVAKDRKHYTCKEASDIYQSIVKLAEETGEVDEGIQHFSHLDRVYGVHSLYGKGVANPYTAFYSGPKVEDIEKAASNNIVVGDDLVIPVAAFQKVATEKWQAYFSDADFQKIKLAKEAGENTGPLLTDIVNNKFDKITRNRFLSVLVNEG